MNKLLSALKVITENLEVLHHNVVGKNFFIVHPLVGEYYNQISLMADDLIEIGISLGFAEPHMIEASKIYKLIEVKKYTTDEVFQVLNKCFTELLNLLVETRKDLPEDVLSKLDDYTYYIRKEVNYKIKAELTK
jgi:DNA-binding ferritin-like protein